MFGKPRELAAANRRSVVSLALSSVVLVAAVVAPTRSEPTPVVVDLGGPMPAGVGELHDGLAHYVVRVEDRRTATREESVVVPTAADGTVEPTALAALARRGRIISLDRDPVTDVVTARLVVEGGEPEDARAVLGAVAGTSRVVEVGGGWWAVTTSSPKAPYEEVDGVVEVIDDVEMVVAGDPISDQQWHLPVVGAPTAWTVADGSGVVVAVVDSGMEVSHPDLRHRIWSNDDDCGDGRDDDANGFVDDCTGWDFLNEDNQVEDSGASRYGGTIDNTHATHVAGIVAAERDNGIGGSGVAPGARIMPLKVSDATSMSMSTVARAVRYAVDNGAHVVNASFGTNPGTPLAAVAPMSDAVEYARSRGVTVVAAAGNSAVDIDVQPTYPASLPQDNVLVVGASTADDQRASFSNWGRRSVDVFAPGYAIVSTIPGGRYGSLHGTSMATPMVAAAAAAVLEAEGPIGYAAVKDRLMTSSQAVPALGLLSASGRRLDLGAVLAPGEDIDTRPSSVEFVDLAGRTEGDEPAGSVHVSLAPDEVADGRSVGVRAWVLTVDSGQVYGVSGVTIETEHGPVVTDDAASVWLTAPAGRPTGDIDDVLPARMSVPAGTYGFVVEVVDAADGTPIGPYWSAFFDVAGPGLAPSPTAPVDDGTAPDPGDGTPEPSPTTVPSEVPGPGVVPPPTSPTSPPMPPTVPGTGPSGPGRWVIVGPEPGAGGPLPPPAGWFPDWSRWLREITWVITPPGVGPDPRPYPGSPRRTTPTSSAPRPVPPASTTVPPSAGPSPTTPTTGPGSEGPSTPSTTTPSPAPVRPVRDGDLAVTNLSPRSGPLAGGTRVWIEGAGFSTNTHVLFGGVAATSVTVVGSEVVLATTPARAFAATVDVQVSTPGGSVVVPEAFAYHGGGDGPLPPPGPGGETPVSTTVPASAPTTAPPTTSPTTVPEPEPDPGPTGPLTFVFGPIARTRGGLDLRPLLPPSPLDRYPPSTWAARFCTASPCPATALPRS